MTTFKKGDMKRLKILSLSSGIPFIFLGYINLETSLTAAKILLVFGMTLSLWGLAFSDCEEDT